MLQCVAGLWCESELVVRLKSTTVAGVLQCVAVYCSVLQCVAVCCSVLLGNHRVSLGIAVGSNVLQCVAACCSMLQFVAACCSMLQCDIV